MEKCHSVFGFWDLYFLKLHSSEYFLFWTFMSLMNNTLWQYVDKQQPELSRSEVEKINHLCQKRLQRYCLSSKWSAGVSLRAGHWANWPAVKTALPGYFQHLCNWRFLKFFRQAFQKLCPGAKSKCPPVPNLTEIPGSGTLLIVFFLTL